MIRKLSALLTVAFLCSACTTHGNGNLASETIVEQAYSGAYGKYEPTSSVYNDANSELFQYHNTY